MLVAGVDEVGRGCLAGPVYAAAVILPSVADMPELAGLKDSKKLSPAARERLVPVIQASAVAWAIGVASVAEIDRLNILQATFVAMQRAVAGLSPGPASCLVDGNRAPRLPMPVRTIVRGDASQPAIMAASVLAKVARDATMMELDCLYPGYGMAQHKGYGTPQHLQALRQLGVCTLHRMSFAPCAQHALPLDAGHLER